MGRESVFENQNEQHCEFQISIRYKFSTDTIHTSLQCEKDPANILSNCVSSRFSRKKTKLIQLKMLDRFVFLVVMLVVDLEKEMTNKQPLNK